MENILKYKMFDHLVNNKLINKSQHGFLPKRSCLQWRIQELTKGGRERGVWGLGQVRESGGSTPSGAGSLGAKPPEAEA